MEVEEGPSTCGEKVSMVLLLPTISLMVILAMSLLIIRVATMALMLTGLSRETARFQAHSAFTGVGFTTREAESVVEHPVRRHIMMALMLAGKIGIATAIAALLGTLLSAERNENWFLVLEALLAGLAVLWMLATSQWIERQMNRPISYALRRFSRLDVRDYVSLLELSRGFAVTELLVEPGDWIANKTLIELGLAREGVLVLGIRRHNGTYIGAPSGQCQVNADDTLIIYGQEQQVDELDSRRTGREGDQAHEAASGTYDAYLAELHLDAPPSASPNSS